MRERSVRVPGDKSLTHRALMFAALASGQSRIRGALVGADTLSTAAVLRRLGCALPELRETGEVRITGVGLQGLREPADVLDCGNSGTTTRLMMGLLAGHPLTAVLTGDASLRSRPMRRVTEPLGRMGARFEELERPDRLPIREHGGTLHGIDHESAHASAQVKSAILLAGLTGGVRVSVWEPIRSRDHTERMLLGCGVPMHVAPHDDRGAHVALEVTDHLAPLDFDVPADFSSAAFVLALGALVAHEPIRVCDVGLNPTRTGLLNVLRRMGAELHIDGERETGGEPIGDVVVRASPLHATRVESHEIPSLIDEIPILAVLAARAEGTTVIEGAGELRVKESDRIHAMVSNLRAVGVDAEELPDGMVVHGSDRPLGGHVRSLHDHRVAMAFGVLGASSAGGIEIDDESVVDVSYPAFWTMLRTLVPVVR